MASTEGKATRRISSLFSMSSSKDGTASQTSQPSTSNHLRKPSRDSMTERVDDPSCRRHAASGQNLTEPILQARPDRVPPTPPPKLDPNLNNPLNPPPSLATLDSSQPYTSSGSAPNSRPGSRSNSRPHTPTLSVGAGGGLRGSPVSEARITKRRSWIPGRSRGESTKDSEGAFPAWIAGLPHKVVYDVNPLINGERISELWDDNGNTLVYLFPRSSGKGPSFRFDSVVFGSSSILTNLAQGDKMASRGTSVRSLESAAQQMSLNVPDASPTLSPISDRLSDDASSSASRRLASGSLEDQDRELYLYLPVPLKANESSQPKTGQHHPEDIETLVLFRNFFAFLLGQALIATTRNEYLFDVFMRISTLLHVYQFSNIDGSTYGEVVTSSFNHYSEELKIADIRGSREKTLEAIVLGERMRSWPLYYEGFVHGVGRWDDLKDLNSPKLGYITPTTRNRMERAHLDLESRLRSVSVRLDAFDFPSVFAGIASSTALAEAKQVRFQAWKRAFLAMRKHVMSHYKERYGSWPPKAQSKKNKFEESGLNRLVLREVYQDFSDLYDLLVERTSLTTRTADMPSTDRSSEEADPEEPTPRAIRRVMSEYDRSTPPVQPPIPFDTPMVPALATLQRGYRHSGDPRLLAKERSRRLKDPEINELLIQSYNRDAVKPSPFIEDFMRLERKSAHGKSIDDLADNRNGQWLFLYAVIQSLPLLIVDAPNIQFTQGVEYFLCEVPWGIPPWCREDAVQARSWYGVAGGAGVVSLPSDIVDHGVEGIYRRSHCWQVAGQWAGGQSQIMSDAVQEDYSAPLPPPPGFTGSPHLSPNLPPTMGSSRNSSPVGRSSQRNSFIGLGLEALPLPAGVVPVGSDSRNFSSVSGFSPSQERPVSRHDPTKSFDDILKQVPEQGKAKRKK